MGAGGVSSGPFVVDAEDREGVSVIIDHASGDTFSGPEGFPPEDSFAVIVGDGHDDAV
jgi:hypothetical protein